MNTYTISPTDLTGLVVTNALTGRVTIGGTVVGEMLCCGCDTPIADGPCNCSKHVEISHAA